MARSTPGTGNSVRALRLSAGLNQEEMADLIGCSSKSVYRWEARGRALAKPDPFQVKIMILLGEATRDPRLLSRIQKSLRSRGGLHALYVLLGARWAHPPKAPHAP